MAPDRGDRVRRAFLPGSPEENFLNGVPNGPTYCPTPVQLTTADATNREVVAYHDKRNNKFYLYSISNLRAGIWIIELQRDPPPSRMLRRVSDGWQAAVFGPRRQRRGSLFARTRTSGRRCECACGRSRR